MKKLLHERRVRSGAAQLFLISAAVITHVAILTTLPHQPSLYLRMLENA